MVALICNTITWEAEEGFGGQLGLHGKTLSQINKQEHFHCEQKWKMNFCECDVCAHVWANHIRPCVQTRGRHKVLYHSYSFETGSVTEPQAKLSACKPQQFSSYCPHSTEVISVQWSAWFSTCVLRSEVRFSCLHSKTKSWKISILELTLLT